MVRRVTGDRSRQLDGERVILIVLGVILLVCGFVFGIHLLWQIGIAVLVIGLILLVLGMTGHAIGGRRHYY